MFHIEVRQFPHSIRRFNMTPAEVGHLVEAWLAGRPVELGERSWLPQQSRLTILEGPRLADHQLSMGRGWRTAQREGVDVTERVLAEARLDADAAAASASAAGGGALADPLALGVQLASLLGADPARLLAAWREVAATNPALAPSESLALAERRIAAPGSHG